ncbi:MAG: Acetyl xylan esterase [Verrucomicrobiales bacterium]|nr:Acetyl xylan esterase [Verrucomicrobiales bacterium]
MHPKQRVSIPAFFGRLFIPLLSAISFAVTLNCAAAPKFVVTPDVESGVYEPGAKVTWNVVATEDGKPLEGKINFNVMKGGLTELSSGSTELKDGKAQISGSRDNPGTILLTLKYKAADDAKEVVARGGAAFAPKKIMASEPPPADFDSFWKSKIAELDAVPMNVKLERVDVGDTNIEYFKITMDNIRGSKIQGQIARPAGKHNLPALLQVQWAGVYPLQRDWVLGYARKGWISLNISAHDLPIDETASFYAEKNKTDLNDYPGIGNDDREKSYFLRMFLSCRRAVDYLAQDPDWDKKALVVHGGSQGGYQAIVTAGLHPAVTAFAASVPAGCDHTGKIAGRLPGWPNWASRTWQKKDEQKMLETSRYFDAMNFATRAKCPSLIGMGLVDTTCPSEGVFATINQLKGPSEVIIMPLADHGGDHKIYNMALGPFLEKQKK